MRPNPITVGQVMKPVFFFEIITLTTTTINLNTGTHQYTFGGKTWEPVSYFGKINDVQEVMGVEVGRLQVSLSGIPGWLFPEVANIKYRNKKMRVLMGLLDPTGALVTEPKVMFTGKVVEYNLTAGPQMGINIVGASNLVTIKKTNVSRYTPGDQRTRFPTDKGLEFIPDLVNLKIQWGG